MKEPGKYQITPEQSRIRVYVLKFKGLKLSLGFGIAFDSASLLKKQGPAVVFRSIYRYVSGTDAEFGFHPPRYLC